MTACNNDVPSIIPKIIDGTFRKKFRSPGAAVALGISLQDTILQWIDGALTQDSYIIRML
jgi:hypothetical protein